MWQHLVVLRDDGQLASTGRYEMDHGSVKTMLYLFDEYTKAQNWDDRKLAVICDGGELSTPATIDRCRELRDRLLAERIYPVFVLWETPWYRDLDHELRTWIEHGDRTPPGTDPDVVARAAAALSRGHVAWHSIADRANRAVFGRLGGARLLAESIAYKRKQRWFDLHVVAFGAGDLLAGRSPPPAGAGDERDHRGTADVAPSLLGNVRRNARRRLPPASRARAFRPNGGRDRSRRELALVPSVGLRRLGPAGPNHAPGRGRCASHGRVGRADGTAAGDRR